jgi:small subunit ribosomal protein S6
MNDYEILLMLDPELPDEKQSEIVSRIREQVEKGGGTIDRHDVWGRRKLAYEIDHKDEGSYHLLLFTASAETLDEMTRVLKIDDSVMRFMATRRSEGGPGEPVAVGAPTSDDVGDDPSLDIEEE